MNSKHRLFAYEEDGKVVLERVKKTGFRKPKAWIECADEDVPDRAMRNAWCIVDGVLGVDAEKAEACRKEAVRGSRRREYPPIADQLDEIMKWLATESEFGIPAKLKSIAAKCMSVKAQYPLD